MTSAGVIAERLLRAPRSRRRLDTPSSVVAVGLVDAGQQDGFELGHDVLLTSRHSECDRIGRERSLSVATSSRSHQLLAPFSSSRSCRSSSFDQHARGALAGAQALGEFERDACRRRVVSPGCTCQLVAQVVEQLLAAAQACTRSTRQTHSRVLAHAGSSSLEEAVERQRVLHFGRVQLEQLGDLHDRLAAARSAARRGRCAAPAASPPACVG